MVLSRPAQSPVEATGYVRAPELVACSPPHRGRHHDERGLQRDRGGQRGCARIAAIRCAEATLARTNAVLLNGTFTAVPQDNLGRSDTNTVTSHLPAAVTFLYDQGGDFRTNGRKRELGEPSSGARADLIAIPFTGPPRDVFEAHPPSSRPGGSVDGRRGPGGAACRLVGSSDLDDALEHKVGRAGEPDVTEALSHILPAHFERVAALHLHLHRRGEPVDA